MDSEDIPELSEPEITNPKKYDPEVHLEDDEWFFIEIDSAHEKMVHEYSCFFSNTAGLNDISKDEFSNIDVIFKQLQKGKIVFQKITASKRLIDKSILKWAEKRKKANRTAIENGIEIKKSIDALFDGTDKLYFRSFRTIKNMFSGIEDYYRVATEQELSEFKELSIISCNDKLKVGTNNLKMLALLSNDEDIDLTDNKFYNKLLGEYVKYPNQDFQIANNQFVINTNKQLTSFLKLALGRLYTNPMTEHKMEASSAKKID